jgi:hypothetical protein
MLVASHARRATHPFAVAGDRMTDAKGRVRQSRLGAFERTAFKPIVEEGDPGPKASKYGGVPWLREGESWVGIRCTWSFNST